MGWKELLKKIKIDLVCLINKQIGSSTMGRIGLGMASINSSTDGAAETSHQPMFPRVIRTSFFRCSVMNTTQSQYLKTYAESPWLPA